MSADSFSALKGQHRRPQRGALMVVSPSFGDFRCKKSWKEIQQEKNWSRFQIISVCPPFTPTLFRQLDCVSRRWFLFFVVGCLMVRCEFVYYSVGRSCVALKSRPPPTRRLRISPLFVSFLNFFLQSSLLVDFPCPLLFRFLFPKTPCPYYCWIYAKVDCKKKDSPAIDLMERENEVRTCVTLRVSFECDSSRSSHLGVKTCFSYLFARARRHDFSSRCCRCHATRKTSWPTGVFYYSAIGKFRHSPSPADD